MLLSKEQLLGMYRKMLLIRGFESTAAQLSYNQEIKGNVHLYINEEAIAVGVCEAIGKSGKLTSTHRGHGHQIAKGSDIKYMMAELFGKKTGNCMGKGGSMHIVDASVGTLGANGIVGGGVVHAVGAAYASKLDGNAYAVACFLGDGATNQGAFQESMNLAAIYKLPVLYVIENNEYAVTTRTAEYINAPLAFRGIPFGIPTYTVDGMDVLEVYAAAQKAVERALAGDGPSLIVAKTYRIEGHNTTYTMLEKRLNWYYRDEEEIVRGSLRCPIHFFKEYLTQTGVPAEELKAVEDSVSAEVAASVDFAKASPDPEPEVALMHVYAD